MPTLDIHTGVGYCLAINLITLLATSLQAAVGFGFNLLAVPALIFLYGEPAVVVPAMILAWYPVGVALSVKNHKDIFYQRIAWWVVPAVPCMFVGIWMLQSLDAATIGRLVGSVTILTAVLIWAQLTQPVKLEWPWLLGTGALSGILAGSTGMSGPPVTLFGINQNWSTIRLRASLFLYFSILGTFTVCAMCYQGIFTKQALMMMLVGLPGMVVGYFLGNILTHHVHGPRFKRIAIVMLIIAGAMPWFK